MFFLEFEGDLLLDRFTSLLTLEKAASSILLVVLEDLLALDEEPVKLSKFDLDEDC